MYSLARRRNLSERCTMDSIVEMFSYSFMVRALIAGVLISLSAALVGVPLVLRKNSMLGDGLSHVAFSAFAIASVLGLLPLPFAIPVVILVSFFILRLNQNSKIHGDSAIALMSASALAIGTFAVSLAGTNVDINNYLFGSILSIGETEVIFSAVLIAVVVVMYLFLHNKIFAITFDEKFAKSIGVKTEVYNILFAVLCSVVVVLGMRLMGALLISSLIVFPVLSAQTLYKSFNKVVVSAAVLSVLSFVVGLILSYLLATPTGATIVIVNLVILVTLKIFEKIF